MRSLNRSTEEDERLLRAFGVATSREGVEIGEKRGGEGERKGERELRGVKRLAVAGKRVEVGEVKGAAEVDEENVTVAEKLRRGGRGLMEPWKMSLAKADVSKVTKERIQNVLVMPFRCVSRVVYRMHQRPAFLALPLAPMVSFICVNVLSDAGGSKWQSMNISEAYNRSPMKHTHQDCWAASLRTRTFVTDLTHLLTQPAALHVNSPPCLPVLRRFPHSDRLVVVTGDKSGQVAVWDRGPLLAKAEEEAGGAEIFDAQEEGSGVFTFYPHNSSVSGLAVCPADPSVVSEARRGGVRGRRIRLVHAHGLSSKVVCGAPSATLSAVPLWPLSGGRFCSLWWQPTPPQSR